MGVGLSNLTLAASPSLDSQARNTQRNEKCNWHIYRLQIESDAYQPTVLVAKVHSKS